MKKLLLALTLGVTALAAAACGGTGSGATTGPLESTDMLESAAPLESTDMLESPSMELPSDSPASS